MATNEELEIYKQRYETFRYLDRLRWQILQIAVVICALILGFGKNGTDPEPWVFVAVGVLLTIFGATMLKIRRGINMNNQVLQKAAIQVGDTEIPPISKWWKSIGCWIPLVFIFLGVICILIAIFPALINGDAGA